jgi:outer membrane protein assembly factor BamC
MRLALNPTPSSPQTTGGPAGRPPENDQVTQVFVTTPARAATLALALGLGGCAAFDNFSVGDKVDYTANAKKIAPLTVPPDLTQLSKDSRYQTQGDGAVSASSLQANAAAARTNAAGETLNVALKQAGDIQLRRDGQDRWLFVPQSPDKLWPKVQAFWTDSGFTLQSADPATGVMSTDWFEDKTKLPQDFIHKALGKVFDSIASTGLRDRFVTRIEKVDGGAEIYITHFGAEEVLTGVSKETPVWTGRPEDPQLEAQYLTKLMLQLGPKPETTAVAAEAATPTAAAAALAAVPAQAARARLLGGAPGAALEMDEDFDRAWRRVGLALDRGSFTVEDRDRTLGVYFVRYVDAKEANKEEPNFFMRLFTKKPDPAQTALTRYRIAIKSTADKSTVAIQNSQGAPDNSPNAQKIIQLLVDDLK